MQRAEDGRMALGRIKEILGYAETIYQFRTTKHIITIVPE